MTSVGEACLWLATRLSSAFSVLDVRRRFASPVATNGRRPGCETITCSNLRIRIHVHADSARSPESGFKAMIDLFTCSH